MARTPRVSGPGPGSRRVEERLVDGARAFLTVTAEDPVWRRPGPGAPIFEGVSGAFVRLEPPADVTDGNVAEVRAGALSSGALRVTVLPRRRGAALPAAREKRPHRKAREVVEELVEEANTEDRSALRDFCEAIMARRGL